MQAYRPDRLVGALNTLVTVAYFGLWVVAAIILIAMPAVKEFAGDDPDWTLGMGKRVAVHSEATMLTSRGPARVDVRVNGDLELPIAMLPWSIVAMRWAHAAVGFALMLMFLHHLRRIFQRVRDGAPFDADNARRLRWLGLLLLTLALFNGVAELVSLLAVRRVLVSSSITAPTGLGPAGVVFGGLHLDLPLVFVALVLLALGEVFRRGAELEDEQSLVV